MILMTNLPIKITQISKDFNIKSKDVIDTFKELGIEKKSGGSADADEFELFLSALTEKHQIKDLDAYRDGRSKIKSVEEKKDKSAPKAEVKAEAKAEPKTEDKKEEKKAAPAPKAEEKKPQPKTEEKPSKKAEENKPAPAPKKVEEKKAEEKKKYGSKKTCNGNWVMFFWCSFDCISCRLFCNEKCSG